MVSIQRRHFTKALLAPLKKPDQYQNPEEEPAGYRTLSPRRPNHVFREVSNASHGMRADLATSFWGCRLRRFSKHTDCPYRLRRADRAVLFFRVGDLEDRPRRKSPRSGVFGRMNAAYRLARHDGFTPMVTMKNHTAKPMETTNMTDARMASVFHIFISRERERVWCVGMRK